MKQTTCPLTLFRLRNVAANLEEMFDAILKVKAVLALDGAEPRVLDHFPVPAFAIDGHFANADTAWSGDYSRLVEASVSHTSLRPAGLILLAVDDQAYALAFGEGYRLLPSSLKEPKFGLRFIIRSTDPDDIRAAVAHRPSQGRTDTTVLAGGAPIWTLGVDACTSRVERIAGRLRRPELTVERSRGGSTARVQAAYGGTGLRLPYGAEPESLVADIRTIARVCREELPLPELEFIERVTQVHDEDIVGLLDLEFVAALGGTARGRIGAVVPEDCLEDYQNARTFGIRIGTSEEYRTAELDIDYVLGRLRFHREKTRMDALRGARVVLYDNERARPCDVIRTELLFSWIKAEIDIDSRRFILMDRNWHEFDRSYLDSITATVTSLIKPAPSIALPAWRPGQKEGDYNLSAALNRPGFVSLDRQLVKTALHRGNGVEIADLLVADDTLVMVKAAKQADVLSHLFNQGVSAVDALLFSSEARAGFAQLVARHGRGLTLPADFRPRRVVFAIHLKTHDLLTADTLFPLAQVALVEAARKIQGYGIEVEVIGIPAAGADDAGGCEAA
ncbi:TIGR04141 family sporadically distributed protein [Streptacidiphilus sp. N1-3]|uniref:TIGR04141 family sporadically distributed protein n=1 Tax=Streptacidiphilus alkalitolerans TaxID=3342712 RepID=A0ABV6X885_9ACTN